MLRSEEKTRVLRHSTGGGFTHVDQRSGEVYPRLAGGDKPRPYDSCVIM